MSNSKPEGSNSSVIPGTDKVSNVIWSKVIVSKQGANKVAGIQQIAQKVNENKLTKLDILDITLATYSVPFDIPTFEKRFNEYFKFEDVQIQNDSFVKRMVESGGFTRNKAKWERIKPLLTKIQCQFLSYDTWIGYLQSYEPELVSVIVNSYYTNGLQMMKYCKITYMLMPLPNLLDIIRHMVDMTIVVRSYSNHFRWNINRQNTEDPRQAVKWVREAQFYTGFPAKCLIDSKDDLFKTKLTIEEATDYMISCNFKNNDDLKYRAAVIRLHGIPPIGKLLVRYYQDNEELSHQIGDLMIAVLLALKYTNDEVAVIMNDCERIRKESKGNSYPKDITSKFQPYLKVYDGVISYLRTQTYGYQNAGAVAPDKPEIKVAMYQSLIRTSSNSSSSSNF